MLYPSKEACINAVKEKAEALRDSYRNRIQSVEDLVQFMFDENVCQCEEYTNWQARDVTIEKAKELLGINLEEQYSLEK